MSGNESMKRSHNAAMSLVLATILHAAPAQVFAQTAGSYDKIKKPTASNATKSIQPPKDITESGKVFLDGCSSLDKPAKQLNSYETHSNVQCLSYVDGIFETMSLIDNLHLEPRGFCAPEQPVQRKELVQIVRNYIMEHPETSNERTVVLVWLALSQAFPCNKVKT